MEKISYFVAPDLIGEKTTLEIIEMICEQYSVTREQLKNQNRTKDLVFARHLCMYLLYNCVKLKLSQVGQVFNRDHTTVMNAIQKIEDYIETNSLNKREEIHKMVKRCGYRNL